MATPAPMIEPRLCDSRAIWMHAVAATNTPTRMALATRGESGEREGGPERDEEQSRVCVPVPEWVLEGAVLLQIREGRVRERQGDKRAIAAIAAAATSGSIASSIRCLRSAHAQIPSTKKIA